MTPQPVAALTFLPNRLPTRQHCLKVKRLMKTDAKENAIILISGAVDTTRNGSDVELEFRQASHFFYLTGVDEPGFHVMMDLQTELVYLIPPTVPESETVWKGAPDSPSELLRKYDVDRIIDEAELTRAVYQYHKVHVLDPKVDLAMFKNDMHDLEVDTHSLRHALNEARLTKFPWEINAIQQATLVSSHAHMALWQHRRTSEAQLAAYFRWMCACFGLDRQAYVPIVASGPRTATLHYTRNNRSLPQDDPHALVLVDAGAEYRCYGSDVTRTFPVTGKFSPEARAIYNIVLAMQEAVLTKLAPGVIWSDMEDLAVQVLCDELLRIGVLVGDREELIRLGIPYAFYFHTLGHSVGLDVHDVGGRTVYPSSNGDHQLEYSSFMLDRPLEPNMVITVEPGLYFNDAYLRIWTQFPGFAKYFNLDKLQCYRAVGGVRIEDTVLITATGCNNLTIAPKNPDEIEAIMAQTSTKIHFPGYFGDGYMIGCPATDSTITNVLPTPTASPLNGFYPI
ncbi:peptidase M24, structural domain-containing protein [Fennellomyces sp. T-0311]|nr:peptidase M24, structural domain-containing protein [Fennellomyces sp. T-0311]